MTYLVHGGVMSDGTMVCGGPGRNCIVVSKAPDAGAVISVPHGDDARLKQLSDHFNQLLEPYISAPKEGRELRMVILPGGELVFGWSLPLCADPSETAIRDAEAQHGPIRWLDEMSPEDARTVMEIRT